MSVNCCDLVMYHFCIICASNKSLREDVCSKFVVYITYLAPSVLISTPKLDVGVVSMKVVIRAEKKFAVYGCLFLRITFFWATVYKTVRPMLSDRCLSVLSVCNVGILWPNGWMD